MLSIWPRNDRHQPAAPIGSRLGAATACVALLLSVAVVGVAADSAPAAAAFGPTQTFTYTGATQSVAVPTRATRVRVDAVGGSGGTVAGLPNGGAGDRVRGIIDLPAGTTTLLVNVGGNGGNGAVEPGSASGPGVGGWNGGAAGGTGGTGLGNRAAGGGGASDVRTGAALSDRIFVAAGGGGGGGAPGSLVSGGRGGDGGRAGGNASPGGSGGGAGTAASGGAGGARAAGSGAGTTDGGAGVAAIGGAGATSTAGAGGGGGGGRFGGGGGGGGTNGGGGGGGSSFSAGTIESFLTADRSPRVLITFDVLPIIDCGDTVEVAVGQVVSTNPGQQLLVCRTNGVPIPSIRLDAGALPPGVTAGTYSSSTYAGFAILGTFTTAGHYSVPVTGIDGAETQQTTIEFQVSAPLGGAPTTTTTSTAPAAPTTTALPIVPGKTAAAAVPATPRFTG